MNQLSTHIASRGGKLFSHIVFACAFVFALTLFSASTTSAQSLNWEGQTGAFITPFAYTSDSPVKGIGHPNVSFHYLNAGSVIGNHFQGSITVGIAKRLEFGYTRNGAAEGSTPVFSSLFKEGFNIFHGKANLVTENAGKNNFVPAVSVGFVARTQVKRVGGVLTNKETKNGDVYIVATKTITQVKHLPILINVGYKGTNASLMGVAGNAPDWTGKLFGAGAFVVKASKGLLIFGSEFAKQPKRIKDLPGATLPTSLTYFVRIVPKGDVPFNIDFGVAQLAGKIAPGVDLKARSQFAMGMSYRF
ncbi:MAG: hypothetical protein AB1757_16215 [Acidobacteriota bacterium]